MVERRTSNVWRKEPQTVIETTTVKFDENDLLYLPPFSFSVLPSFSYEWLTLNDTDIFWLAASDPASEQVQSRKLASRKSQASEKQAVMARLLRQSSRIINLSVS